MNFGSAYKNYPFVCTHLDIAQFGRAAGLYPACPWFKSKCPDFFTIEIRRCGMKNSIDEISGMKEVLFAKSLKEELESAGVELTIFESVVDNYGLRVALDFSKRDREKNEQLKEMQSHIDCLQAELQEVQSKNVDLPTEPIKVADMLINASSEHDSNSLQKAFGAGDKVSYDVYSVSDLRQIAEHLLVYCNNAEVK